MDQSQALSIVVKAKDEASAILRKVQSELNNTADTMNKAGKQLKDVGGTLTKNVTLPIVAIGAAGVKSAMDFQTSMSNLSTLIAGDSTAAVGKLSTGIKSLLKTVPQSADDLGASAYSILSAGITDTDKALQTLQYSAKLATAGLGTTAEATDLMTSALNAFKAENLSASQTADILFKTVKNGKTTVSELAQGFGAVAGTVAANGIPLKDFMATTAALTTVGVPASQAYSQLRAVIAGLTRETDASKKIFSQLGVTTFPELIKKTGGVGSAMQAVSKAANGNQAELLQAVGSVEALAAIQSISGPTADAYASTLKDMGTAAGGVEEAFNKQNQTAANQFKILKNNLNVALIDLGNAILPTLLSIVKQITPEIQKLAAWFQNLSPAGKKTVLIIAALAAAVGPTLIVIGKLMIGLSGTIKAVVGVGKALSVLAKVGVGAIRLLSAAFMANPILAAIMIIVGALIFLQVKFNIFGKLFEAIKPVLQSVGNFFVSVWNWIVQAVGTAFTAIANFWNNTLAPVFSFIGQVLMTILTIYIRVWAFIALIVVGTMMIIGNIIWSVMQGIWNVISTVWNAVWGVVSAVIGFIWNLIVTAFTFYLNIITTVLTAIWNVISSIWNAIYGFLAPIVSRIYNVISNAFSRVWGFISSVAGNIWNAVSSAFNNVINFAAGIGGRILRALGNIGSVLYNSGKDLIQGFLNGAGSLIGKIASFFLDKLPGWIKEPFKKALGIHSPSKVFAGFGANVTQGLADGIVKTKGVLGNAMSAVSSAVTNGLSVAASPTITANTPTGNNVQVTPSGSSSSSPAVTATPTSGGSDGAPNIEVNVTVQGNIIGNESGLRDLSVILAQQLQNALKSQGTTDVNMIRASS